MAVFRSRTSLFWDEHKRPVKRSYQVPAIWLAHLYRSVLTRPLFVAVTGSLGKTQCKSLIAAVLSKRGPVRFDPSTDNRTYDVAKNLLKTWPSHSACVQEIGLAGPGTMARPVHLFRPEISVITNIRSDHSAEFTSHEEHVLEKGRILGELPESGWAVLNADEPDSDFLIAQTSARTLTYGFSELADVRAMELENRPPAPLRLRVSIGGETHPVLTQLHGAHSAEGVLAALAVGHATGVSLAASAAAIALVRPAPGRMQFKEHPDGVQFLLDDFKASAGSLVGIVEYLRAYKTTSGRRYLVLGSITHEADSVEEDYLRVIAETSGHCDEILLVGALVSGLDGIARSNVVQVFKTTKQCADYLNPRLRSGDLVVLKGLNSSEHLRRIEMNRQETVNCWQMNCERRSFCNDCLFVEDHLD